MAQWHMGGDACVVEACQVAAMARLISSRLVNQMPCRRSICEWVWWVGCGCVGSGEIQLVVATLAGSRAAGICTGISLLAVSRAPGRGNRVAAREAIPWRQHLVRWSSTGLQPLSSRREGHHLICQSDIKGHRCRLSAELRRLRTARDERGKAKHQA